jgi:hypothetical protein
VTLGKQEADGMSALSGWLTPEARATLEAVLAKLAAPGMCNPADQQPTVNGAPSEEAMQRDPRSPAQRQHDGLNAALRALLASGDLGQHNGLPASIIVSTTLAELEAAAGHGITGGGTCRTTDIDNLTLTCGPHHRLLQPRGWTTRRRANGDTEWIPPPHLDRGHRVHKLLRRRDGEEAPFAGHALELVWVAYSQELSASRRQNVLRVFGVSSGLPVLHSGSAK